MQGFDVYFSAGGTAELVSEDPRAALFSPQFSLLTIENLSSNHTKLSTEWPVVEEVVREEVSAQRRAISREL